MLAAALLTVACGGSDRAVSRQPTGVPSSVSLSPAERGVHATIDALQVAIREGKSDTSCQQLFTEKLRRSIGAASERRCAAEVGKLFDPKSSIAVGRSTIVRGAKAAMVIRAENGRSLSLRLVRQGRAWKIDRLRRGTSLDWDEGPFRLPDRDD